MKHQRLRVPFGIIFALGGVLAAHAVASADDPQPGGPAVPQGNLPTSVVISRVESGASGVTIFIRVNETRPGSTSGPSSATKGGGSGGPSCSATPANIGNASVGWFQTGAAVNPGRVPYAVYCDGAFQGIVWLPTTTEPSTVRVVVEPGGSVDPRVLAQSLLSRIPLPEITIGTNPGTGLVALASWFWVEGYDGAPITAAASLGGVAAVAAAGLVAAGAGAAVLHRRHTAATAGGTMLRPRFTRPGGRGHRRPVAVQGDMGRVRLAGWLVLAGLAELGFGEVRFLTCQEDQEALVLRLACPPGDEDALVGARFALARRLGCLIDARVLPGHQVELTLTRLRREAAALFSMTNDDERRLLVVPVGAADGAVTYLNLGGVSGIALHGTDIETAGLLRTWLATLAASVAPGAHVVARAPSERIPTAPDEVEGRRPWSSEEHGTTTNLIATLETQLAARLSGDVAEDEQPAIVVLLTADPDLDADRVETLLRRGRQAYMHTVMLFAGGVDEADASHVTSGCEAVVICAGAQNANGLPPGSLTLAIGGGPAVTLQPVQLPGNGDASGRPDRRGEPVDEDRPFAGGATANGILPRVREPSAGVGEGAAGISVSDGDGATEADAPAPPWSGAPLDGPGVATEGGSDEPGEPARRGMLHPAPSVSCGGSHQVPLAREGSEPDEDARIEQSSSRFDVRCYGGFTVRLGDTEVVNWKMQKARELLAYLLARGGVTVPREEAGEALWPELDPEQMQRMLSDAAYHLRRALKEVGGDGIDPLITQGQRYRLRQELFSGELFEWAGPFRQARQARIVQATHAAAKLAMQCRDTGRAAGCYRTILEREPIEEEAARGLMRCLALLGDTNGVRKVYKVLVEALRRELDDPSAEPLPDTSALLHELVGASGG
jgi:DNA-binding SARP family transcriptional activator